MAWIHKLGHPLIALTGTWAVGSLAWSAFHDPVETIPAADCKSTRPCVVGRTAMQKLQRDGYVVIDNVLSVEALTQLRRDARSRFDDMKVDHQNPSDVRTDHVTWVRRRMSDDCESSTRESRPLDVGIEMLQGLAAELDTSDAYTVSERHSSPANLQVQQRNMQFGACVVDR